MFAFWHSAHTHKHQIFIVILLRVLQTKCIYSNTTSNFCSALFFYIYIVIVVIAFIAVVWCAGFGWWWCCVAAVGVGNFCHTHHNVTIRAHLQPVLGIKLWLCSLFAVAVFFCRYCQCIHLSFFSCSYSKSAANSEAMKFSQISMEK